MDELNTLQEIEHTSLVLKSFYIGYDDNRDIVVFRYMRETKKGYSCEAIIYSEHRISFDKNLKISSENNVHVVVEISKDSYKSITFVLKQIQELIYDMKYYDYTFSRLVVNWINTIDDVDHNIFMTETAVELSRGFFPTSNKLQPSVNEFNQYWESIEELLCKTGNIIRDVILEWTI